MKAPCGEEHKVGSNLITITITAVEVGKSSLNANETRFSALRGDWQTALWYDISKYVR